MRHIDSFSGLKVFTSGGISLRVHPTWLIIALIIFWALAGSLFPTEYPDLSTSTYAVMGLSAALLLFVSILIHEACHAIVARYYGLPVREITLWMFGGVAGLEEEPRSSKVEIFMAAVGPLASFALAGLAWAAMQGAMLINWSTPVVGVLDYLWRINLILAIFNLVPAFPLDGGRIIRGLLWRLRGRKLWATRVASRFGEGFGFLLIVLGLVGLLGGAGFASIWYALIGLVILGAARSSYKRLLVEETLQDVPVEQVALETPVSADPNQTIEQFVTQTVNRFPHRVYPVLEEGRLVGSVAVGSLRNIDKSEWAQTRIEAVMRPANDMRIDHRTSADRALKELEPTPESRLIVTEGDNVLGVVGMADLMKLAHIRMELHAQ